MQRGDGVVVVEHNLDFLARVDWIVDLGPGGGHARRRPAVLWPVRHLPRRGRVADGATAAGADRLAAARAGFGYNPGKVNPQQTKNHEGILNQVSQVSQTGWQIFVEVPGKAPIELPPGESVIGRSRACIVQIAETTVSRQHAIFVVEPGKVRLRDLGSSNGTFVNGQRVDGEIPLADGDRVVVGEAELVLRMLAPLGPSEATAKLVIPPLTEPPAPPESPVTPPPTAAPVASAAPSWTAPAWAATPSPGVLPELPPSPPPASTRTGPAAASQAPLGADAAVANSDRVGGGAAPGCACSKRSDGSDVSDSFGARSAGREEGRRAAAVDSRHRPRSGAAAGAARST